MKTTQNFTKGLIISTILLFAVLSGFAQGGPGKGRNYQQKKEKIKAYKIAFITEKLNLTTEEAEKFWPVYNEHMDEMDKLQKKKFSDTPPNPEELSELSDEKAETIINEILVGEQKILELKIKFRDELKPILSAKKILMLFDAEREFRMELMKRLSGNGISERPERPERPERRP